MEKGVIFDLDGTLIDSVPDICLNLNIMLEHFNYPKISIEKVRQIIGKGARRLVRDSLDRQVSEQVLDQLLAFYNDKYTNSDSPKTQVYSGVMEVLKTLKARGYKLAVCTNKPNETTVKVVELFFPNIFDCVLGQSLNRPLKPQVEAVSPILEQLNLTPENVYFVGDMQTDYLTSANLKCKHVMALWGYGEKSQLQSLGASVFANSPKQLLDIIL